MIGSFFPYSVIAFTHIWMLWLVLIDSLYYFICIAGPLWDKSATMLDSPVLHFHGRKEEEEAPITGLKHS